ncbi:hypothetical protein [Wielerella bovis]|uniref:hypothetical protein n=1 Tax=Wielerella bovis TaxID=2917790 RepID=UPI002018EFF6|nr:hypothetical protein [Wielerella bovis]ULJ64993.1 hypothetical protein MIS33_01430 [Wielerella bovis]ULJ67266.1 hypothetical protein MIS31_01435 [Wielerella bovis]
MDIKQFLSACQQENIDLDEFLIEQVDWVCMLNEPSEIRACLEEYAFTAGHAEAVELLETLFDKLLVLHKIQQSDWQYFFELMPAQRWY